MAIYKEWLLKAKRDLDTAKALLEKAYFDTAIYHTQQCRRIVLKIQKTLHKPEKLVKKRRTNKNTPS